MTDLAATIKEAVRRDGLRELRLWVSRFNEDGTPAAWAAECKWHDRVGSTLSVRANPIAAVNSALDLGRTEEDPLA